jgi:hypothetical protein
MASARGYASDASLRRATGQVTGSTAGIVEAGAIRATSRIAPRCLGLDSGLSSPRRHVSR